MPKTNKKMRDQQHGHYIVLPAPSRETSQRAITIKGSLMSETTSGHAELEALLQAWNDDYDAEYWDEQNTRHILTVEAHRIEHRKDTRAIFYICPLCNHEHHHGIPWSAGPVQHIDRVRHCVTNIELSNTTIRIKPPSGYAEHWFHGNAWPGSDYPRPVSSDSRKDYEPRSPGPCPSGCIKNHAVDDLTEEHYSIMRTNYLEAGNQETSRYMVRTQQFTINTDPQDVQRWINIQFHDLDLRTWQEIDLSIDQAEQLAGYLTFIVEGADTLESIVPAVVRYKTRGDQRTVDGQEN